MNISYDPDADALTIRIRKDGVDYTKEVDQNTLLDFNNKGELIGVELLFVKERNPAILKEFKAEHLISG